MIWRDVAFGAVFLQDSYLESHYPHPVRNVQENSRTLTHSMFLKIAFYDKPKTIKNIDITLFIFSRKINFY